MKILLCNRDESSHMGGDAIQVRAYQKYMQQMGHEVDYHHELSFNAFGYDLAILFHINFGWTVYHHKCVQAAQTPYYVVPIYYPGLYSDTDHQRMKDILKGALKIICLSPLEKTELLNEFENPEIAEKTVVIDNGVDREIFNWTNTDAVPREYVMTAGRIEGGKGHLLVQMACKELGLPCVSVGPNGNGNYRNDCKQLGRVDEGVDQKALADYYRRARVFVLGSDSERNNLTILEAAACGATVIDSTGNRGSSLHSFYICNPLNPEELKQAIQYAWDNPRNDSDQVKSWDDIVRQILC
jgi:glycosyltransferase involved in cell wall biosynthesis